MLAHRTPAASRDTDFIIDSKKQNRKEKQEREL
jgi:hypothetical protein